MPFPFNRDASVLKDLPATFFESSTCLGNPVGNLRSDASKRTEIDPSPWSEENSALLTARECAPLTEVKEWREEAESQRTASSAQPKEADDLRAALDVSKAKIRELEMDLYQQRAKAEDADRACRAQRLEADKQRISAETCWKAYHEKKQELETEIRNRWPKPEALEAKCSDLEETILRLQKTHCQELEKSSKVADDRVAGLQKELRCSREERNEAKLQLELEERRWKLVLAVLQQDEGLPSDAEVDATRATDVGYQLSAVSAQLQGLRARKAEAEAASRELKAMSEALQVTLEEAREKSAMLAEELRASQEACAALQEQLQESQQATSSCAAAKAKVESELEETQGACAQLTTEHQEPRATTYGRLLSTIELDEYTIKEVQNGWETVEKRLGGAKAAGEEVFGKLKNEVPKTQGMLTRSSTVWHLLSELMQSLNEPKLVQKRLEYIALRHMNADITTADVEVFRNILFEAAWPLLICGLGFRFLAARGFVGVQIRDFVEGMSRPVRKRAEQEAAENVSIPASSDDEGLRSPKAARGGGEDHPVTLSELRSIMLEQTRQLQHSNETSMDKAVKRMEKHLETKLGDFEERVTGIDDRVGALEKQIEELLKQGAKAPQYQGLGQDDSARRARTLVYGGWPRDTRRKVILDDLKGFLEQLKVHDLIDSEPFTTGARRSMAMSGFSQRPGESFSDMRSRMHKVVVAFSQGGLRTNAGKAWASYSKTRAERLKSSHAGWVKKAVAQLKEDCVQTLEVEWQSGSVWYEDFLLASADLPVPPGTDMRGILVREDVEGQPWVSTKLIAQVLKVKERDRDNKLRVLGWNLGGVEVQDLSQALDDAAPSQLEKGSIVLYQEAARGDAGWTVDAQKQWTLVTHRHSHAWRGCGIMYQSSSWCLLRRVFTTRGVWFKIRAKDDSETLWVGTCHFTPGCTFAQFEEEAEDHFRGLPKNAVKVVFQGDVNTPFGWTRDGAELTPVAREGKGGVPLKILQERGMTLVAPHPCQFGTPTSRPRQEGRAGQQIDVMARKGLHTGALHIHVDSYMKVGTDHELLQSNFASSWSGFKPRRQTRSRVLSKPIGVLEWVDQSVLGELAVSHTKPKPSQSYRDPDSVKLLFRKARLSGTSAAWKEALKSRKLARKAWETDRVHRATMGDWESLREIKGFAGQGWDVEFALHQQGDPHEVIHNHFQGVYQGSRVQEVVESPPGDVRAFDLDELWAGLRQLKGQKAVGCDLTSKELLQGICMAEGGAAQVLEFYNRVLATAVIPPEWNKPLLVMLPKIAQPRVPKHLRPIALGSSVGKLFSRLLLNRCLERIRLQHPPQCAGVHRQTNDYTFTLIRLFELEREWQGGMAAIKVDVSRAFDDVDRDVLLAKLEAKLGPGAEMQCWKGLLANNEAMICTPFGESVIGMSKGIKQGGVESPAFYGMLMELAAHEAEQEFGWAKRARLYPDLSCPDTAMFMDDGVLWSRGSLALQKRVAEFAQVLLRYGLKVNIAKCQLYCAPKCPGPRQIRVEGTVLHADTHLEVMGLTLSVGQSICSLISPLMTRCRAKFWEVRHVLRSNGPLHARVRLMQRIVGASALWCIASVPPDKAAMTMANSVQLQLMVWLLKLGKRATESWVQFRQRAFRSARAVLNNAGCERWSTLWLRRYWQFAGHRARALALPSPVVSAHFESFRPLSWWQVEKYKPNGVKHHGKHFARLTLLEQSLDSAAGGSWRGIAMDRVQWQARERVWIENMDLPLLPDRLSARVSGTPHDSRPLARFAAMGGLFIWICLRMCLIQALHGSTHDGWGQASTEVFSFGFDGLEGFPRTMALLRLPPRPRLQVPASPLYDPDRRLVYLLSFLKGEASELLHGDESDASSFMQGTASAKSQAKGWFTKAKEDFATFHAQGLHRCAALHLRDLLREAHPAICRRAREYLPLLLGDSSNQGARDASDPERLQCQAWAQQVLDDLTSLVPPRKLREPAPASSSASAGEYPYGLFHAIQVWPNGSYSVPSVGTGSGGGGASTHSSGREVPTDEETDEAGLLSLTLVTTFLPLRTTAFDELFDGRQLPDWFLDQVDVLEALANRGARATDMALYLEDVFLASEDDRMINALAPYVNAMRYRMETYVPHANAMTRAEGVPSILEWSEAVIGIFRFMKERWLWKICPTAMWNQRHERFLADQGYCNVVFSPEHYVGEDSERRELSRSRSPHRRDRQPWRVNEVSPPRAFDDSASEQAEGSDVSSFMMTSGRGNRRPAKSRSRDRDRRDARGDGPGDSTRDNRRGSEGRRRVLERRPVRITPGPTDAHGGGRRRDPRYSARSLRECRQIQNGGPLISDATYRNILVDMRARSEQERHIMSIAVVSYIRALMVELGEVCHEATLHIETLDDDEVLVEVDPEDDTTHLMQLEIGDVMHDKVNDRWSRQLVRLQKELAQQIKGLRRAHVADLLGRLRGAVGMGLTEGFGAQLEALLLAMTDPEVHIGMPVDSNWLGPWAESLGQFIPGMEAPFQITLNDSLDENDLVRAAEQAEASQPALPDEPASSSWEGPAAVAEVAMLRAQEHSVLLHQASVYRDWEDWEMMQASSTQPAVRARQQCVVEVEGILGKGKGPGGPQMTRSWLLEVPPEGNLELRVRCRMEPAVDQDDVQTQILPDTKRRRQELAEQAARGDPNLQYTQYADLYQQWLQGRLGSRQVQNLYGAELLSTFEAQFAMSTDFQPDGRLPGRPNPLTPLGAHGCLEASRYERIYGLWKEGWLGDSEIVETLGPRLLEMMACQQLGGGMPSFVTMVGFDEKVVVVGRPDLLEITGVVEGSDGTSQPVLPDGHPAGLLVPGEPIASNEREGLMEPDLEVFTGFSADVGETGGLGVGETACDDGSDEDRCGDGRSEDRMESEQGDD
ncbi:RTase [Symbiodinium sp. CCMP2592]|nr:RTase [Symbiodinium sp. CCMP2592]